MLYHFYEWNHAALTPFRAVADATRLFYQNPLNPLSHTQAGRTVAAMAELFERTTRVYGKPEFGLYETLVDGQRIPVQDRPVWRKPFAELLHFERELPKKHKADPRFLVVAPMSGHYATLLRGTVEALLPHADVYITDWQDARGVPLSAGGFDLDDYVDYVTQMLEFLGPDTHVIAVCQPAVPVIMAVARMEAEGNDCAPTTMTLMGGPIDTRINPTAVNRLAEEKGIDWFRDNVIMKVPFPQAGFMRDVYPGFLQLTGFMSMNLDRHMIAHKDFFWNLVRDDGDSAEKHREFYDEYNAVMDLTAEFYLQTVEEVFIRHSLPKGEMMHRGKRIDLTKIRRTALLTIEGENDDISGVGQTEAAQTLCTSIPDDRRVHYVQPKVGHYGVFNGSRFRAEIAPRIVDFALTHGTTHAGASLPRRNAKSGDGMKREGAVEERRAKAKELGESASAGGETGLSGVIAPAPAAALNAAVAPAEALVKTIVAPAAMPTPSAALAKKAAPAETAREERTATSSAAASAPAQKAAKSPEPEKAAGAAEEAGKSAPSAVEATVTPPASKAESGEKPAQADAMTVPRGAAGMAGIAEISASLDAAAPDAAAGRPAERALETAGAPMAQAGATKVVGEAAAPEAKPAGAGKPQPWRRGAKASRQSSKRGRRGNR